MSQGPIQEVHSGTPGDGAKEKDRKKTIYNAGPSLQETDPERGLLMVFV